MIELHLRGRVAPGRREDLIAFLHEAIPFYEQPGGIRVRLMWEVAEPDRFIEVVEVCRPAQPRPRPQPNANTSR